MAKFVVHSMGKCASRSIHKTLVRAGSDATHAHYIYGKGKDKDTNNTRYVISPIREPVRRNISAYFENYYQDSMSADDFIERYPHHVPLLWFDREVRRVWSIDVYDDEPVASGDGWWVYAKGGIRLLVIRMENLDRWDEAFWTLTGDCAPELMRVGVTAESDKGKDYKRFLDEETIPAFYYDFMARSKFVERFYDDKS